MPNKRQSRHPRASKICQAFAWLLIAGLVLSLPSCKKSPPKPGPTAVTTKQPEKKPKQPLNETLLPPVPKNENALFRRIPGSESGIEFENNIVENDFENILTYSYMYNGGGVAVGDINNDGLPDLFLTSNQGANGLYLNRGGMRFEDISQSSGISQSIGWHSGVNMCDVNEDGRLDIYVCRSGPGTDKSLRENLLFINEGDLQFSEQAAAYGIADNNHSTQASFFDYDRDGDLDLYVLNHPVLFLTTVGQILEQVKDPSIADANSDNLYRNNGDGSFTKVTEQAGCKNLGYGLGLITADLNGDGWTDIYVANDFWTPDFMYINQQDGTFADEIKDRTGHVSYYGMGCDLVDINCDLNPDLVELDMTAHDRIRSKTLMPSMSTNRFWALVARLGYQYQYMFNSLQLNQGEGYFSEMGQLAGVAKTDWSWAVLGADFDHDGWDDLVVTNGFRRDSKDNDFLTKFRAAKRAAGGRKSFIDKGLMMKWVEQIPSQRIRNYLFRNNGDLTFADHTIDWGFHEGSFSSGAVYADLDIDGDLDLVINNIDDPVFIYQNRAEQAFPDRTFVCVLPVDETGSPVLNAKVKVVANGHHQMKELTTCRGYQSAVAPILHFGLGNVEQIDSITVYWPDETTTVVESVAAGVTHEIGKSDSVPVAKAKQRKKWFEPSAHQPRFRHQENYHDEYKSEVLLPHSQSTLGPCLAIGDVNGDGREDMFVGSARGFSQDLLLQTVDGKFEQDSSQTWRRYIHSENVDAVFFDADDDGDEDLYVGNGGGSEFEVDSPFLYDQFFRNNDGQLDFDPAAIPQISVSTGTVVPIDFDSDGDLDLFVGGHVIPGRYPFAPRSYLLENEGGKFTEFQMPVMDELGMINDSVATDFDADGLEDLILVGEWTPVIFLKNNGGNFEKTKVIGTDGLNGWWFSITEMDVNSDGRPDYLLGNLGENNKFKSKNDAQLKVVCNDFDDNGTFDIVLATEVDGRDYPVRGKECSTQQMPFLESKFRTFHEFAVADLSDILGKEKLEKALHLEVNTFASCLLVGQDAGFKRIDLPKMAQMSPIRDAIPFDINRDGHLDIVAIGNLFNAEVETIRYDGGMGLVLVGNGNGEFEAVLSGDSGFRVNQDSRHLAMIKTNQGDKLIVANNNDRLMLFDMNDLKAAQKR